MSGMFVLCNRCIGIGRAVTLDCVLERYEAIRLWHKSLTSPDSEYWVQLAPGTAVGECLCASWKIFCG